MKNKNTPGPFRPALLENIFRRMSPGLAITARVSRGRGRPADFRLLESNPAFGLLCGRPTGETTGALLSALLPVSADSWLRAAARASRGGDSHQQELPAPEWNRRVQACFVPLGGTRLAFVLSDITPIHHLIGLISQGKQEWQATFDSASELIIITDRDDRIIRCNRATTKFFGADFPQLLGRPLAEISGETLPTGKRRRPRHESGRLCQCRGRRLSVNRSPFEVDGILRGYLYILNDVTEQQRAIEAIRESARLKSHFVSMVSHELKIPLTIIGEGVALLADGTAGPINRDQKMLLETIERNSSRLNRLIRDVLDFRRLEEGALHFSFHALDPAPLIRETVTALLPAARARGITLETRLPRKLPAVRGDRDRITQVLVNIIGNAIHFTDRGGVTVEAEPRAETVAIAVRDSGIGISRQDQRRVFEEFAQFAHRGQRRTGGTGLGLVISRQIVRAHGGDIQLESAPGRGTTVSFSLPLAARQNRRKTAG